MEQKKSKVHKKMWSVLVSVHGVSVKVVGKKKKKKIITQEFITQYMHPTVIWYYQEDGILYIKEKDHVSKYDISRIESIHVREHKRSGVQ